MERESLGLEKSIIFHELVNCLKIWLYTRETGTWHSKNEIDFPVTRLNIKESVDLSSFWKIANLG